jgi:nitrite reductase/ring-hydroxylating ferredoxin subunit
MRMKRTATSPPIARRAFLSTAASVVLGAVLGEWWGQRPRAESPPGAAVLVPEAGGLPPGGALALTVPGTEVQALVVRLSNDTYAAFDRRCPHLGCPVIWSAAHGRFECPCHAAIFEAASGRVLAGPPRSGLRRIGLEERNGNVWVRPI